MTTGVIIARFQVPELTIGHKAFIIKVLENFDRVAFVLGEPAGKPDGMNPLTTELRTPMLTEWDPVFIAPLKDVPHDNDRWSMNLDRLVAQASETYRIGDVTLVGGRMSFIPSYRGTLPTKELPVWVGQNGTQVRENIMNSAPLDSVDFRRAVIWTVGNYEL
jgi:hypothetical protein